jgi:hypothetical protein
MPPTRRRKQRAGWRGDAVPRDAYDVAAATLTVAVLAVVADRLGLVRPVTQLAAGSARDAARVAAAVTRAVAAGLGRGVLALGRGVAAAVTGPARGLLGAGSTAHERVVGGVTLGALALASRELTEQFVAVHNAAVRATPERAAAFGEALAEPNAALSPVKGRGGAGYGEASVVADVHEFVRDALLKAHYGFKGVAAWGHLSRRQARPKKRA